jgi:hypothetical protein
MVQSRDGLQRAAPADELELLFLLAGLVSIYAIHRFSLVQEQGEIERREMMSEMVNENWRGIRNISTVAGLRGVTAVPVSLLRDARVRLRWRRARASHDNH